MTCGGGYPGMKKCFLLVLETGNWLDMNEMNHGRTESQFLVKLQNNGDILAIGKLIFKSYKSANFVFFVTLGPISKV